MLFRDRCDAGELLGRRLHAELSGDDLIVIALPRGGVRIGKEIASALSAPLDFIVVRKLGAPWQKELAIGAIAEGGFTYLNKDLIDQLGVTTEQITRIRKREEIELERRAKMYRQIRPQLHLEGKALLLVDDGIATGATVEVAIRALKANRPQSISVATPVASIGVIERLHRSTNQIYALKTPSELSSIGDFYESFEPVTDEQVIATLKECARESAQEGVLIYDK